MAAATLEQDMGRRSVAAAIRPIKDRAVASSSSATEPITQKMVAEACDTLIREKHPASSPEWPEGSGPPIGQEGPEFSRNLLPRDARRRRRLDQSEAGPQWEQSRGQNRPCLVRVQSSGRKNRRLTYPRPRDRGVWERRGRRARGQARPEGGATPLSGATHFRPRWRRGRSGARTGGGHGSGALCPLRAGYP